MSRSSTSSRLVGALLLPLLLAACGGPPRTLTLSSVATGDSAGTVRMFVATTRASSDEPQYFTGERGPKVSFATLDMSVPRAHKTGEVELPGPGGRIDPAQHFAVVSVERRDLQAMVAEVRREIARRPQGQRDVLVFVHGFNTNFADAAYRFAQIVHDSGFSGVPVLFTWPSRGELLAYPYDRESALYSRDFLELGLRAIARDPAVTRLDMLAHSMGTLLTLETLRQASIRGDGGFAGKLRNVMLAAPDVDLDIFRTQMEQIRRPVTVFISKDDRALDISRRFAGDKKRLGAVDLADTEIVAGLRKSGVDFIDLSDVTTSDSLNHGKFASSPKIVQMIGLRLKEDRGIATRGPGLGDHVGDVAGGLVGTVGSTINLVVSTPGAIIGR